MSEPLTFEGFSKEAIAFLEDLRANNDRAWFGERKAIYEREIKRPAKTFATALTSSLQALTGKPHGHRIFRIHRDVRFSKDKTPYNTHLHIAFIPEHGAATTPAWFFGLDPDKLTLGTGIFAFDKEALSGFRERVLGEDGTTLKSLLPGLEREGVRLGKPDLKRVPSGFPKDHANADLLRHKGLSAWIDHAETLSATDPGLVQACLDDFRRLKPLFDWLNG